MSGSKRVGEKYVNKDDSRDLGEACKPGKR